MLKPTLVFVVISLLLVSVSLAGALPQIESIRGAQSIAVGAKTAVRGSRLAAGDRFQTNESTSVRLVYPDRSQLMVGRSSEVEILPQDKDGAQWTHLHRGGLKAVVVKAASKSKKPRFVVRTKAAVMGVRGTEFDVKTDAQGEQADLHTLDGQVEVAKDQQTLEAGKGTLVKANEFVQASLSKIELPKKFDRTQYLNEMKKLQPDFQSFLKTKLANPEELNKLQQKAMEDAKAAVQKQTPQAPAVPTVPPVQVPSVPKNPFGR